MSIFTKRNILIVEDDMNEGDKMSRMLTELAGNVKLVKSSKQALDELMGHAYDFLLTDLHLETKVGTDRPDGLEIIAHATECQPNLIIVAATSDPRSDIWAQAVAKGAQFMLRKPVVSADELVIAFHMAKERKILTSVAPIPTTRSYELYNRILEAYPSGLVIEQRDLQRAQGLARKNNMSSVLVGETGTGKEEFARLLHRERTAIEGKIPFVAVNCATIPQHLAESIFFGHRRGAFTGADSTTTGLISEADGGILFLDEIHTLNLATQQKLLRVLNDGSYNRLGETRTYTSRFQLISATTKDLDEEAEAGTFLLDLIGRISGLEIKVKPLRDRKEQIAALTALFLKRREIFLDEDVFYALIERLKRYYWRGNIRQLFKTLDVWITQSDFDGVPLHPDHLPVFKGMEAPNQPKLAIEQNPTNPRLGVTENISSFLERALHEDMPLESSLDVVESALICAALTRHKTIGACASALGLSRSTFDAKRRKLNIS